MNVSSFTQVFPHDGARRKIAPLAALGIGLTCFFAASLARAQSPVKLRYQLRPGDQYTYVIRLSGRVTVDAPGQPPVPPVSISGQVRQERTVRRVLSDGSFELVDRTAGGVMTVKMMGQSRTAPIDGAPVQVSTINPLGRVTFSPEQKAQLRQAGSRLGFDPGEFIAPFAALQAFPMEALSAGSKWQRTAGMKFPPYLSLGVVVDNKLTKFVTVGGRKTAEVASTLRLPIRFAYADPKVSMKMNGGLHGSFRSNYALLSGMPVRTGGSFSGTIALNGKGMGGLTDRVKTDKMNGKVKLSMTVSMALADERHNVDPSTLARASGPTTLSNPFARSFPAAFGRPAPRLPSRPPVRVSELSRPAVAAVPPSPLRVWVPNRKGSVARGEVSVQVAAPAAEFQSITLYVNGHQEGVTNALPYRFTWDTTDLPAGVYQVRLEAHGEKGKTLYKSPVQRVRLGPEMPPAASDRKTARRYPS
jgi:hypothetical protein